MAHHRPALTVPPRGRGFTLIELLVVILIIGLVSVVALPTIIPALSRRETAEAARILQGSLVGARDQAIHDGRPSGIRLLADPAFYSVQPATLNGQPNPDAGRVDPAQPLAYNRIVPISQAPEYSEGAVTISPATTYADIIHNPQGLKVATPTLVLESAPRDARGPLSPTSWFWNIRVGERVQVGGSGPWYTVCGPIWEPNPEGFTNVGRPGIQSPLVDAAGTHVEYLLLCNGTDDNLNGWRDEGFDGVDNDGDGLYDEATCKLSPSGEWEPETWRGALAAGVFARPYVIERRPIPIQAAREVVLPGSVVIDATTWNNLFKERSVLPVDADTGMVEVMVGPDGTVATITRYGVPASVELGAAWLHFWLAEREDVVPPSGTPPLALPIAMPGGLSSRSYTGPTLRGEWAILSLSLRTGQTTTRMGPAFDDPIKPANGSTYDPAYPRRPAEQGSP